MKIKCGTDIIEIERVKSAITSPNINFIKKVYTENEISYCEKKKKAKYQHYAARFAAKEAVYKAINSILDNKYELDWKDIEIQNKESGEPFVVLKKHVEKINNIEISISHCKEYATANVIVQIDIN